MVSNINGSAHIQKIAVPAVTVLTVLELMWNRLQGCVRHVTVAAPLFPAASPKLLVPICKLSKWQTMTACVATRTAPSHQIMMHVGFCCTLPAELITASCACGKHRA